MAMSAAGLARTSRYVPGSPYNNRTSLSPVDLSLQDPDVRHTHTDFNPQHHGDSNSNWPIDEKKESTVETRYLERMDTNFTSSSAPGSSGEDIPEEEGVLYKRNGELVKMPAPTKDPKDPLNLPTWHKLLGMFCMCCFGALAASAELILGAMLPVFALQYAGIDPKFLGPLTAQGGFTMGSDPLAALQHLPNAPPIWKTYMLASMPVLMMGIANLILIPVAIAVGRRPVLLFCGVAAIVGAIWAGFSQSLESHIAARCIQALGAGTVESLIPFMLQDMVYVHQRNFAISGVFAAQGTIIIALGIASPYFILDLSWRWVYFITAAGAGFFLVGTYLFMPETRWHRTKSEYRGISRPDHEFDYAPRTWKYNLAIYHGPAKWNEGVTALLDSLRTFFYPHILFITMLNSAMIATAFAAGYTATPALLTQPWSWPFKHLGFCLFPILIAAVFVAFVTGNIADSVANYFAKKRGKRAPENQLINLILPTVMAIVGTILFGQAGQHPDKYPWAVFLLGLGMMAFGFLGANTVGAVYVLECYPQLAGPALVNIASFRCIIAFILSFKVSEWIVDFGYWRSELIYTGIMGFFALFLPVVYIWGPAWRKRWPGPQR